MRELVMSTVKMINSIRRKGGVHPVMSSRQIITGRRMKLPPYPPGSCVYAVRGGTTNSVDNMRSFAALYLRPNDEGGGHFVYNINTMQRCSACRVIGINKKPIPMPENVIDTINKHASEETNRIEFADINLKTTVNNYKERGYDSDSDFEDDDKSYETSDDSTVNGDTDLGDEPDQLEEDQQQHFNVQEVNDVDEDDSSNGDEGVGRNELDESASVHDNQEVEQEIEEEDGIAEIEEEDGSASENEDSLPDSARGDEPSTGSVETVDNKDNDNDMIDNEPPLQPVE